jgi:hypothetical protein
VHLRKKKDLNTLTNDYAKECFTKQKKAIITKMWEKKLKESQSTSQATEDWSEPLPQNEEGDTTLTAVEDLIDPIVMNDLVWSRSSVLSFSQPSHSHHSRISCLFLCHLTLVSLNLSKCYIYHCQVNGILNIFKFKIWSVK